MPRGSDSFVKHKAVVEQRRAEIVAQQGEKADYFGIKGGQFAAVRFLEEGTDIAWAQMHRIPVAGRQYPQDVICLDQEDDGTQCPFCQSEFKGVSARSTKGFYNVLWRGNESFQETNKSILMNSPGAAVYQLGATYKRNEYGSPEKSQDGNKIITGYADVIALWKASKTVHDMVVSKDSTYRGLSSRDFVVGRTGNDKDNTVYTVEPLSVDGGPQSMSAEDHALAAKKYDLDKFITPMDYDLAVQMVSALGSSGEMAAQQAPGTFARGAGAPPAPGSPPAPGVQQQPNAFQHPAPASNGFQQ